MRKKDSLTGTIRVHSRGFGFVVPDDRDAFPLDIFIPRHATKGAVDGDCVRVVVNSHFISKKGPEGTVIKIVRRRHSHVAGTITFLWGKKNIYAYVPLIGKDQQMRITPSKERNLQIGDRIIIHVLNWGSKHKESVGEMSAYIGHISDPACDTLAAVKEFDLKDAFSDQTVSEAQNFGTCVTQKEIKQREDLRDLDCMTIDPDTAKDFDDALSIWKDKKGCYHLGVHIADVSYYVTPGSSLDKEAYQRCNSVYFPSTVLPMLPHELSSHLCSLKPNVNRLAVSILMVLSKKGELKSYRITRSVIRSKKRFTYKEAKEVLEGKKRHPFQSNLKLMAELCGHLKRLRTKRGCIEFALPDISILVDKKGKPKKVEIVEYDITHQLVEEFMLKANEIVATHLSKEGKPLTYRIHEEPNPENIKNFAATATALGFQVSEQPDNEELQILFDEARESPFGQFLAMQFIRSMKLASYSTQNIGHFGLGLEHYTHFTSPIRRYIDLVVHRLLFEEIDPKNNFEHIARLCSEQERRSSQAENTVILSKKLRLLHTIQTKTPNRSYRAVVLHVKSFGFVFEISEFLLEGFIGQKGRYKMGDKIRVKLTHIDLIAQEVAWELDYSQSVIK